MLKYINSILKQDLTKYLQKSGDTELSDGTLITNSHGFCVYKFHEDSLVLLNVYGDGEYWNSWATEKAKQSNIKKILIGTKRSPKGFTKKFGFKVTGYILERTV